MEGNKWSQPPQAPSANETARDGQQPLSRTSSCENLALTLVLDFPIYYLFLSLPLTSRLDNAFSPYPALGFADESEPEGHLHFLSKLIICLGIFIIRFLKNPLSSYISYSTPLIIFLSVLHDPTHLSSCLGLAKTEWHVLMEFCVCLTIALESSLPWLSLHFLLALLDHTIVFSV